MVYLLFCNFGDYETNRDSCGFQTTALHVYIDSKQSAAVTRGKLKTGQEVEVIGYGKSVKCKVNGKI